jgi:amidase
MECAVTPEQYADHDATSLAALVRDGEVSPRELLQCAVARIDEINPRVNAVVRRMFREAHGAVDSGLPKGPLRGVPFLLKDLMAHYAGVPTSAGSRFLQSFTPAEDSELVARFKRAGLVIMGKTNTPELGIMGVTEPELFGPTRNPYALDRTPGGSSGGSAVAVATRMVPAASAGDGGGSIRIPASACGLFGLKPTRGRSPVGPDGGAGWMGFAEQHVLTRSVRDSAAFLDAIVGPEVGRATHPTPPERPYAEEVGRDPGRLRVAFTTDSLLAPETHPACVAAVESAAALLRRLGHDVQEAKPRFDRDEMVRAYLLTVAAGIHAEVESSQQRLGRRAVAEDFEPSTWLLHAIGGKTSAGELARLTNAITSTRWAFARFHTEYDVWLTPTMARPPARIGEFLPKPAERAVIAVLRRAPVKALLDKALDELARGMLAAMPNTQLMNMTGQPAMNLPLHHDADGVPVGVQIVGRLADEATLLRLASQVEAERPWGDRRPPDT